jgi:hypothetical protein
MRSIRSLVLATLLVVAAAGIASFARAGPPALTVPNNMTVEAQNAAGAAVTFTITAVDPTTSADLNASCDHPTGGAGAGTFQLTDEFPLGTTTVSCTTTVSATVISGSFTVTVRDTTPPHLVVPANTSVDATTSTGASASDPAVATFLRSATATDLVDPAPAISNDAPALFPIGTTTVTFVATDSTGNSSVGQASLTVQPPPQKVTSVTPDNVTGLSATAGDRFVRLSWDAPKASDFDHLVVMRSRVGGPETTVYQGSATTYLDRKLLNGVEYRYVVVSFDHAGDHSSGAVVVATPKQELLTSPRDGAKVSAPPRLTWVATHAARYYNVQLWHGSKKILSSWPAKNALTLKRLWTYAGHRYRLTRGRYRWYVWPGFGARAYRQYGPPLGTSSFQLVR